MKEIDPNKKAKCSAFAMNLDLEPFAFTVNWNLG
jgi:hypothetical protein